MSRGLGVDTKRPGVIAGPFRGFRLIIAGRCLSGVGPADGRWFPVVLANAKLGRVVGQRAKRLPEQVVGHPGHRYPAALALAVKRADHVIGESGRIQVSGHDKFGMMHENTLWCFNFI
jgi:hypothetical protein